MSLGVRLIVCCLLWCMAVSSGAAAEHVLQQADGYSGIWYQRQKVPGPYKYKYSGGLGTYCAKHKPFAVYSRAANKTFFCYGGAKEQYHQSFKLDVNNLDPIKVEGALFHMVGAYDHATGKLSKPVVLLDKKTHDAHDNPVISMDDAGHIWIFSSSHAKLRPSFVHKSTRPYSIDAFERVMPRYAHGKQKVVSNFSYMQVWHVPKQGFVYFFTLYDKWQRKTCFARSTDGVVWERLTQIADIEEGHYQISAANERKAVSVFNYHPHAFQKQAAQKGLNWRTNLYYAESLDRGQTWQSISGQTIDVPVRMAHNPTLIHDYESEGLLVYLKDVVLTEAGRPYILYMTSRGYRPGPEAGPRTWKIAAWTGSQWQRHSITTSDNNYDMGSLYLEADGGLRVLAPTGVGPQAGNPGGEVVLWEGSQHGKTWRRVRQLTQDSQRNHSYVRRPVHAHPDFYGFWADGHGRQPSPSRLYFCNSDGVVFQMPAVVQGDWIKAPKR